MSVVSPEEVLRSAPAFRHLHSRARASTFIAPERTRDRASHFQFYIIRTRRNEARVFDVVAAPRIGQPLSVQPLNVNYENEFLRARARARPSTLARRLVFSHTANCFLPGLFISPRHTHHDQTSRSHEEARRELLRQSTVTSPLATLFRRARTLLPTYIFAQLAVTFRVSDSCPSPADPSVIFNGSEERFRAGLSHDSFHKIPRRDSPRFPVSCVRTTVSFIC